jgi:hypothetical protein
LLNSPYFWIQHDLHQTDFSPLPFFLFLQRICATAFPAELFGERWASKQ